MMTPVKIKHTANMFGHVYTLENTRTGEQVMLPSSLDHNYLDNHAQLRKPYYWFRAPRITLDQILQTMQALADMHNPHQLEITQGDDNQLQASLKLRDAEDAAMMAWGYTEIWAKWDPEQEKHFRKEMRRKPTKLRVGKDGKIKVRVTVSGISDP